VRAWIAMVRLPRQASYAFREGPPLWMARP
jgi:hypothetical protein